MIHQIHSLLERIYDFSDYCEAEYNIIKWFLESKALLKTSSLDAVTRPLTMASAIISSPVSIQSCLHNMPYFSSYMYSFSFIAFPNKDSLCFYELNKDRCSARGGCETTL
ncbi:unnamed protein product [Albugo candida]|uniref:Uncharacterized protein n=1 Tax=Albugo candida TaxID=65357 RepID=A0A024FVJ0_9STRA|nr:unnamed protein product [Albugo candida]|eukprot:CCI11183.1 unnamed protein product [Albugo candida]